MSSIMIKSNFKITKESKADEQRIEKEIEEKKDYSQKEFEEFVSKSGAAGSFMIFRSEEKDTELGIDQL
jgi:hypothetical protein